MTESILIRRYHKRTACLCVCPSVRMERIGPHWSDFREILCRVVFINICREISRPDKIGPKIKLPYLKPYVHLWLQLSLMLSQLLWLLTLRLVWWLPRLPTFPMFTISCGYANAPEVLGSAHICSLFFNTTAYE